MATALVKPGHARALARCLLYERCPACNRYGRVTATRTTTPGGVTASCGHCGAPVTVEVSFAKDGGGRWQADITDLTVPE